MGPQNRILAAETAQLAENLPDGAAGRVVAVEEEHLADLLVRFRLARTGMIVTEL